MREKFPNFDTPVLRAIKVAFQAGNYALAGVWQDGSGSGSEKDDPNVGHHAIVTKADVGAQELILRRLSECFPARFITEEKAEGWEKRIIGDSLLGELPNEALVFGVDPIDGTSGFDRNLYEWSTSIGVMEKFAHTGGAIYAPAVRGGVLVAGQRGVGVSVMERGQIVPISTRKKSVKDSMVFIGPDIFFLDGFGTFLREFSKKVRTTNCTGSCAVGLAMVAAGRIDALIQPVQSPWDWFAGYPLVEEAGGKFQFYHYREGEVIPMEKPDLLSYSSEKRNTAFIAGNPDVVDWLFECLVDNWQMT